MHTIVGLFRIAHFNHAARGGFVILVSMNDPLCGVRQPPVR
jgi:hypothetical protein